MEVSEPNSRLLRALKTFAIVWVILWISLGIAHFIWVKTNGRPPFMGLWLIVVILFQPPVLLGMIAFPEIMVTTIMARIRIKESQQWRKKTSSIHTQPSNQV